MKMRVWSGSLLLALLGLHTTGGHAQVYSNGGLNPQPLTNSGVAAPTSSFWSEVQADAGNTTESNTLAGIGGIQGSNRIADDFVVPPGQSFVINAVDFYAYKTGAPLTPTPIAGYTLRIWNGRPGDGGATVIFGDTTTNRLQSSQSTSTFRIFNTTTPAPGTAPGTTRLIWRNRVTIDPPLTLTAGTYWLDWASTDTSAGNHFHPSVTLPGARTAPGWNARQFNDLDSTWVDLVDTGNPAGAPDVAIDMPFDLVGPVDAVFDDGFEDPAI